MTEGRGAGAGPGTPQAATPGGCDVSEADFLAQTGPVLWHVTPAANLPGIRALGLLSPATLFDLAEEDPAPLRLRTAPVRLRVGRERALIGDRAKLLEGAKLPEGPDFLEGHTLDSWAAQLDRRVFFWPDRRSEGIDDSRPPGTVAIAIDASRLYRVLGASVDLAPINTGAAVIRPVRRGNWIYTPATEAARLPRARIERGLVKTPDEAVEVSLRGDLTPPRLAMVLAAPLPTA